MKKYTRYAALFFVGAAVMTACGGGTEEAPAEEPAVETSMEAPAPESAPAPVATPAPAQSAPAQSAPAKVEEPVAEPAPAAGGLKAQKVNEEGKGGLKGQSTMQEEAKEEPKPSGGLKGQRK